MEDKTYDQIIHPSHYNQEGAPECIEAMEAVFGRENVETFCHINAFKYLYRAGHKGSAETDLAKACWYIDRCNRLMGTQAINLSFLIGQVAKHNPKQAQFLRSITNIG